MRETSDMAPWMIYMEPQPSYGTTMLFNITPISEATENPANNRALILTPKADP